MPELSPVERRLARCATIADLRELALRSRQHPLFDIVDGGACVARALSILAAQFDAALTLAGVNSPSQVTPVCISLPACEAPA